MQSSDSTLTAPPPPVNLSEKDIARFWAKVNKDGPTMPHMETPCWVWIASRNRAGYGAFKMSKRQLRSHRVSYELANGPIPHDGSAHGICVCHRCDVRECCNPYHLFLGTNADNIRDMSAKGRVAKGDKNGSHTKPECVLRGENNGAAKLTAGEVEFIRVLWATGKVTKQDLAVLFGVSRPAIHAIIRRKIWRHI